MTPAKLTLREEIENLLLARIDRGLVTNTAPLAENIMTTHNYQYLRRLGQLRHEDRDFYEECAWHHVKNTIRIVLRDYKVEQTADKEQLLLQDCECLSRRGRERNN
jgi:hypothetical protein